MRYLLAGVIAILVGSCASHPPQATSKTIITAPTTVIVRAPKQKKCKVVKPPRPKPLPDTLPFDSPKQLIDLLTVKLTEWSQYGDKVEQSLNGCRRS